MILIFVRDNLFKLLRVKYIFPLRKINFCYVFSCKINFYSSNFKTLEYEYCNKEYWNKLLFFLSDKLKC